MQSPKDEEDTTYPIAHDLTLLQGSRSRDVIPSESVTFDEFPLSSPTRDGLKRCRFERPSPIQLQALPLGLCGFDLLVQSKAGTGKTCVFCLIALESLKFSFPKSTQTLIITPTREVAMQIHHVMRSLGSCHPDLHCVVCIGGIDVKQDRTELTGKNNRQIVIGTPGRVKQLIELNILMTQNIELLVLDEADKLMEEQFKAQIDDIYKRLPMDKQMIVTSATYPDELAQFLKQYMRTPKTFLVGQDLHLAAIKEHYVECEPGHSNKKTLENKLIALKNIVEKCDFTKCIVFTNFQSRAPVICENLNKEDNITKKYGEASYLCAELSQNERIKVFSEFKNTRKKSVLVSTDVSARGIDIHDIELVINFDLPIDSTTYYHRIGRAGRFGQPGNAITIVSRDTLDRTTFQKNVMSDRINKMCLA